MTRYAGRSKLYSAAALLCGLLLAACGGNPGPQLSPEAALAVKGRAVVNAARAVLPVIDQEMTAGRLPKTVGIPVLEGMRHLFVEASNLADALKIVDEARTADAKTQGFDAARAAIATIRRILTDTQLKIPERSTAVEVLKLLTDLSFTVEDAAAAIRAAGGSGGE